MPAELLLEANSLHTGYGGTPILQGIDLAVSKGDIVAVIGRNGVGKTTLLKCLIGLLPATNGRINYRGADLTGLSADQRARQGIGYIPQGREVFPRMTVEENLLVGELIGKHKTAKLYDLVYEYFPVLAERRRQKAGTMSGGEQQMLAIGRVLVGNPDLILLDEPSEGIQPSIVQDIGNNLVKAQKELGITILFVEQNIDMIHHMARHCYVMDKGRIIDEVPPDQLNDPATVRRYLAV